MTRYTPWLLVAALVILTAWNVQQRADLQKLRHQVAIDTAMVNAMYAGHGESLRQLRAADEVLHDNDWRLHGFTEYVSERVETLSAREQRHYRHSLKGWSR